MNGRPHHSLSYLSAFSVFFWRFTPSGARLRTTKARQAADPMVSGPNLPLSLVLATDQAQSELRDLVRLREDRSTSLGEDLVTRQVRGFRGHIHVTDARVRGRDVQLHRLDVAGG